LNNSEYNVTSWADYIINNPDAISKYWLNLGGNTNDSADGWRLDVENEVAHDFWVYFRNAINTVKPEAPMVAENWGDASMDLLGDSFNSVMNYQFRNAMIDFILDKQFDDGNGLHNPIDAAKLDQRLTSIYERYPLPAFYSAMNLLGSHDTMRILTVFGYNSADSTQNSQAAKELAVERLKLATIFQMGYPGMPSVYYGDEAGQSGSKDPDDRRTFPWGSEDTSLQSFFTNVANIRDNNQVLKTGDLETLYAQGNAYAIGRRIINGKDAFGTSYPDSAAIVVINKGGAQSLTINTGKFIRNGVTFKDALNGGTYTVQNGQITINVGAMNGAILISDAGQDLTAPVVVSDLSATSGNGNVNLTWTGVSGAVSYNIYRSTIEGGLYEKIATETTTNYNDTTVTNGLKYVYAVTTVDSAGNESLLSNEVSAYPAYPIGWAGNLTQVANNHLIGVDKPTEDIYAEVWADGLTNKAGQGENMLVQLGYRYVEDTVGGSVYNSVYGTVYSSDFTWIDAQYVSDSGNNDKYKASFLPDMIGIWEYTMRFSNDVGQNWTKTEVKQFTVVPSGDTEIPTAPILIQPAIESSRVVLNWNPSTDNTGIYQYEIYRAQNANGPFSKIDTVLNNVYSYTDTNVSNGTTYYYEIAAVDPSFNKASSNIVKATPDIVPIQVTFNVTVPDYTPLDGVNIAGSFPNVQWNPGAQALNKTGPNTYSITLTLNEGTQLEYKYARGSWDKVEKDEFNNEIDNRKVTIVNQGGNTMTIDDIVKRWRDLPIYIYAPIDKTTVSSETSSIEIKGNAYKGAKLTINNEDMIQAENGVFTKNVSLVYGQNTIKIHVEPNDSGVYGNDKGRIAELTKDITINVTRSFPSSENNNSNLPSSENNNSNASNNNSQGTVTTSGNTTILTLDENKAINEIKNSLAGEVVFDLTSIGNTDNKALEIPVTVLNTAKDNNTNIVVKADEVKIELSKESLDLTGITGNIKLAINNNGKVSAAQALEPLTNIFDISIKASDKAVKLNKEVKVTLNIGVIKDARKAGVYYYNETTGQWEYVGGKVDKEETITFNAKHFSKYAAFEFNKTFGDVNSNFWANDVISVLAAKYIVKGIDNNNFAPNANITRAEFASMMIRLLGIEEETYNGEFNDVKTGAWYANAIETAYKAGIIIGDGKAIRPNDPITREEMSVITMRVYNKLTNYSLETLNKTAFKDNLAISGWAMNSIANAAKLGVINGQPGNLFMPKDHATRAEASAVIYRLLEKSGNL